MLRVGSLVERFTQMLQACGFFRGGFEKYEYFGSAAVYHDIGKAWIPHSILTKPAKLTREEILIMRRHPALGHSLLGRVRRGLVSGIPNHLVLPATVSASYHHEWWDGGGYPYGLCALEIPLLARITAICDAYDAMTSDRSYRKGHSKEFARRELASCSGTQFDPELVSLFLTSEIGLMFST